MHHDGEGVDKRAPMAPAPMRYAPDGSVAWGEMWDSFCVLALEGGPRHRATLLEGDPDANPESAGYRFAADEIARGVLAVSGLSATPAATGWLAIGCHSVGMAHWLADAIVEENVAARAEGIALLVPVGADYTLKGEIKSVITAVAKTTHYWREHLPNDVKQTLEWQARLGTFRARVAGWFGRGPAKDRPRAPIS